MNKIEELRKIDYDRFLDLVIDLGFSTGDNELLRDLMNHERASIKKYDNLTRNMILNDLTYYDIPYKLIDDIIYLIDKNSYKVQMLNSPIFDLKKPLDRKLAITYIANIYKMFLKNNPNCPLELKHGVIVKKTTLSMKISELITNIEFERFDELRKFKNEYTNLNFKILEVY